METKTLTGQTFLSLLKAAVSNLNVNCNIVNDLNVFPVPDGDTGDNMLRTIQMGLEAAEKKSDGDLSQIAQAFSHGALLGARGNSGVILSQFFKGLEEGLSGKKQADVMELCAAYESGVKKAYNAVVKPVEGTMLTVFKEAGLYASNNVNKDSSIEDFYKNYLDGVKDILPKTKEMLSVLKEADVIDSGGAGYLYIVEGMYNILTDPSYKPESVESHNAPSPSVDIDAFTRDSVLDFGYCTECLLRLQTAKVNPDTFDIKIILDYLESIGGDSVVCYKEDDVVKLHVHTPNPGNVLNELRKYGEFLTVKIENMALQHEEIIKTKKKTPHKKLGVVAVANGKGITDLFKELGADEIVEGGQTGNPASKDFIQAFDNVNADDIIVLPNNPNIVLTAEQAASIYKDSKVHVIPTQSFTQGNAALAVINPFYEDLDSMIEDVKSCIEDVVSASVALATKDAQLNSKTIKEGDYLGLIEKEIVTVEKDRVGAVMDLVSKIPDIEDKELCTLFWGADVTLEEVKQIEEKFIQKYPDIELTCYEGNQAVFSYLISFE